MKLLINEVARYLDLPVTTLERWIRQGRIPIVKEGLYCTFRQSTLERWAKAHSLAFSPLQHDSKGIEEIEFENLLPVMERGGVVYGIEGEDVESVLRSAVAKIPGIPEAAKAELLEGLIERERLTSTGIGKGVAIPHPRMQLADICNRPAITTCFLDRHIAFDAVDDRPVFVMFVLLSPSIKAHLHLLSRLSFCVRDDACIEFLKTAPPPEAFFKQIEVMEKRLDAAEA